MANGQDNVRKFGAFRKETLKRGKSLTELTPEDFEGKTSEETLDIMGGAAESQERATSRRESLRDLEARQTGLEPGRQLLEDIATRRVQDKIRSPEAAGKTPEQEIEDLNRDIDAANPVNRAMIDLGSTIIQGLNEAANFMAGQAGLAEGEKPDIRDIFAELIGVPPENSDQFFELMGVDPSSDDQRIMDDLNAKIDALKNESPLSSVLRVLGSALLGFKDPALGIAVAQAPQRRLDALEAERRQIMREQDRERATAFRGLLKTVSDQAHQDTMSPKEVEEFRGLKMRNERTAIGLIRDMSAQAQEESRDRDKVSAPTVVLFADKISQLIERSPGAFDNPTLKMAIKQEAVSIAHGEVAIRMQELTAQGKLEEAAAVKNAAEVKAANIIKGLLGDF